MKASARHFDVAADYCTTLFFKKSSDIATFNVLRSFDKFCIKECSCVEVLLVYSLLLQVFYLFYHNEGICRGWGASQEGEEKTLC